MARPKLGDSDTERLHMKITKDELEAIDEWRYSNRVPSRSEAVRRLVQIALIWDEAKARLVLAADEAFVMNLAISEAFIGGDASSIAHIGERAVEIKPIDTDPDGLKRALVELSDKVGALLESLAAPHDQHEALINPGSFPDVMERSMQYAEIYKKMRPR